MKTRRSSNIRLVVLISLTLVGADALGQNLILNPSFEDTVPRTYDEHYEICKNWWNPSYTTAEYITPFCEELNWAPFCAPDSPTGFQVAQDEQSYVGIMVYGSNSELNKDYLEGVLESPLVSGQCYQFSAYCSWADESEFESCELEVALTPELNRVSAGSGDPANLGLQNQVALNLSNIDTVSWHFVQGSFYASGDESYIYIGSYSLNADLDTCASILNDSEEIFIESGAYLYIDNVCLSPCNSTDQLENLTEGIKLAPNPVINGFRIQSRMTISCIELFDVSGRMVYRDSPKSGDFVLNIEDFTPGIFTVIAYFDETNEAKSVTRIVKI